ncbi:mannose-1-phosphate guanylyltransferase/mannose-6-phosphate isomerase [Mangrovicella endophytica]|uniref:mannose-1-phosphate guanylyltransferase/mannose-6-phosphate isomerase n=1 Tax=Mangrovicella endophytica TaxID=2066697 RepID=UPI000C9EA384|nr:mannose-1-phosphate guanylyltransferase/mannose-6-phosphate isomerase [Mangrovicella endophytica]
MTIYPVILSGGRGTRLWPLSRGKYPKQFIRFFGEEKDTLLGATLTRLPAAEGFAPPTIICNDDHRFLVRAECEQTETPARKILLETVARNTAPAIACAALDLAGDPDAILCVMPSDHTISDPTAFAATVKTAAVFARDGKIVLFGIRPTSPHTGYGYIKLGQSVGGSEAFAVDSFKEKPDAATAQSYLDAGDFLWNSGIFVFRADTFLRELERFEPAVLAAAKAALASSQHDLEFDRLDGESLKKAPSISVDHAVMERTDKAVVIPLPVDWNDMGSWTSLWDSSAKDGGANVVHGRAVTERTTNSYIHSEKALVATIGVDNLVIVETPDALLVADKTAAQDVGPLVERLRREKRSESEQHLRNYRPWGFFETLSLASRFQVKLLHVSPGRQLSMQMHHHRSEHWIVVQGTAKVTVGSDTRLVRENESLYISATEWHRLENPGKVPLELIEVQIGSYLGEDDIVRSDDVYNRKSHEV